MGLVSLDHDRPMLPNELERLRQNTAELAATWTPQMQHLVDRATQRLLWSLVEVVLHDNVRDETVSLWCGPDRSTGSPMELCNPVFREDVVQCLLYNDESVRDVLDALYHMHAWEEEDPEPYDDSSGPDAGRRWPEAEPFLFDSERCHRQSRLPLSAASRLSGTHLFRDLSLTRVSSILLDRTFDPLPAGVYL